MRRTASTPAWGSSPPTRASSSSSERGVVAAPGRGQPCRAGIGKDAPVSPRRPDADVPPGLLLVDKSDGMTSHDVVARARRALSIRKVGHAGTLDPMATGLLLLGVGAATRLLGYVGGPARTFEATLRVGQGPAPAGPEGGGTGPTS